MSFRLLTASAGMIALAACASAPLPQAGSLDASIGEATKYNAAIHIINPDPVYTADGAQPGDNGQRAADATKRYRTGQVKETESLGTSDQSSGGGSGPQ